MANHSASTHKVISHEESNRRARDAYQKMQNPKKDEAPTLSPPAAIPAKDIHPEHTTKEGEPDRRFVENRDLPPPPKEAAQMEVNGTHLTHDGAPDRRYKENVRLSKEEVEIERSKRILSEQGIIEDLKPR